MASVTSREKLSLKPRETYMLEILVPCSCGLYINFKEEFLVINLGDYCYMDDWEYI